jgi:hypothetical protein
VSNYLCLAAYENDITTFIGNAIGEMPFLKRVAFEFCDIVTGPWLQHLPKTIIDLSITCTPLLKSETFEKYLRSHGATLKRLILNNNNSLNLDFLSHLKSTCPRLEELSMNLIYFKSSRVTDLIPPNYDQLLSPNLKPTWPTTMRRIDMSHLRHWESDAVVMFFESLTEEAEDLRNLRYLSLSVHVDLPWHERAGFRDKWTTQFKKIFKRKPQSPVTYMQSFKSYRLWMEAQKNKSKRTRRSSEEQSGDSSNPSVARLRPRRSINYASDSSSPKNTLRGEVMAALGGGRRQVADGPEHAVQGLCEVVDIRIDNGRPNEKEFRESDMLDSEESGDSDYDS